MAAKKYANFRLTDECHALLKRLADDQGTTRTAVIERLVRDRAEQRGFRSLNPAPKKSRKKSEAPT